MAAITRPGSAGYGVRRTGSFASKSADAGIVADAFLSTQNTSTRIKKPGIPSGTPNWLKTSLEILEGRRGNKIEVPQAQDLTFSASPTQAELEALHSYTNQVRETLEQLINRMDG